MEIPLTDQINLSSIKGQFNIVSNFRKSDLGVGPSVIYLISIIYLQYLFTKSEPGRKCCVNYYNIFSPAKVLNVWETKIICATPNPIQPISGLQTCLRVEILDLVHLLIGKKSLIAPYPPTLFDNLVHLS